METAFKKIICYLSLAAICLVSVFGAAVYYFYQLNWLGISATLFFSAVGFYFFFRLFVNNKKDTLNTDDIAERFIIDKNGLTKKKFIKYCCWVSPYIILQLIAFILLFQARTSAALTSPWQVVSGGFFIVYLLATGYLFYLILKNFRFTLWLIVAHYFLSFSIFWIVFKIGFGYDPFIHQATVGLIDKNGFVLPKTPYYLGQYSLILILHKLFFVPIAWADKLLLPILAAVFLPPVTHFYLKKSAANNKALLPLLLLLILPFSIFTLTVPQNLAYLFLLLSILVSLSARTKAEVWLSFLVAAAALAAHPIAGIPAILFATAIFVSRQGSVLFCYAPKGKNPDSEACVDRLREGVLRIRPLKKITRKRKFSAIKIIINFLKEKNLYYTIIYLLTATVLPFLFYLTGKNSSSSTSSEQAAGFVMPGIIFPRQENIYLNFIYFFLSNEWLILLLLAIFTAYIIHRWHHKLPQFILLGSMAASLLIAYFITRQLNFSFLISYERNDYAQRILIDAFIFIIPIIAVAGENFIEHLIASRPTVKYTWLVLIVILITISLYGSYPRLDNYYNSHGFSVGATDLDAVNWIAQDASSTPYVVLADQQVSVGALWTFGFSHYFKNNIYFYPIPTGGPLYQIYLDMVYQKPDRKTALQAAELTGARTVYFAINKYWAGFDKIVEQARVNADSWQNIDNGELYIFKYSK